VESDESVDHGGQGDEREEAGADLADAVAEVEQADGQAAEDDGEVEPGEEGALVGEEDFGLDAGGEGDAFAWGGSDGVSGCWRRVLLGEECIVYGTYRERFGVVVGSTWLVSDVFVVVCFGEAFNGRSAASNSFNGQMCVVLQILADLRYCNSSDRQGRNVVVVYCRRDTVARPSTSPTDLLHCLCSRARCANYVRRLVTQRRIPVRTEP